MVILGGLNEKFWMVISTLPVLTGASVSLGAGGKMTVVPGAGVGEFMGGIVSEGIGARGVWVGAGFVAALQLTKSKPRAVSETGINLLVFIGSSFSIRCFAILNFLSG
jgi:hypothetical protein